MATWVRQPQEKPGNYWFGGVFYVTKGVFEEIPTDEVAEIVQDVQATAKRENGLDYLQE